MTSENEQMPAMDRILRRAWIDPMDAFADAAHAAREDAERRGSVPARMMLLTQQRVVLSLGDADHAPRRFVWLALPAPGDEWSHVRVAATAVAAHHVITAALIVAMRGDDGRFLCLVFERPNEDPVHLRATVACRAPRGFVVGDFSRTWHPWAEQLSAFSSTRPSGPRRMRARKAHLRVLPGGKR